MRNDNARFSAILAAVALPVTTWIAYGYLSAASVQPSEGVVTERPAAIRVPGTASLPVPDPETPSVAPVRRQRPDVSDAAPTQQPPAARGAIHKCRVEGEIVYSDLPCNDGTAVKTFAPSVAAAVSADAQRIPAPANPVADAQAVRTAPSALPAVAAADTVASEIAKRQAECKWIGERIAAIDARLRQPYFPQEGDRLKDERKALTDRRFSLGC